MQAGPDWLLGALFGALKTVLLAMAVFFLVLMSPWAGAAMDAMLEGQVSRTLVKWTHMMQDMIDLAGHYAWRTPGYLDQP